jgi:PKD repeat protein
VIRSILHKTGMPRLLLAIASLALGSAGFAASASAAQPGHPENANGKPAPPVTNPYSPAYDHPYRHGVIPTIGVHRLMQDWARVHETNPSHPVHAPNTGPLAAGSPTLSYGGGVSGVGVMSGQNKVYLIFYGTQWGTSSTDANGNLAFTNDAAKAASAAQQMFKGIGTNNETWQNDLTQWCNGAASGATSCAAGLTRIPRQSNILAGVWYDNAAASPTAATGTQLAQEAIRAAAHFGNTAAGSNRSTYYVILSPKGTNPDNYQGQYCAWHDYTGDGYGVTAPGGDLAFSNQPYNIDSGAGCGVNFVNAGSAGTLDGYTMTLGHEWHEMMSDQFPAGGWTNHNTGTYAGQENSDECAWISPGQAGGAANVAFSTGTFAQQASWSNDTNNCAMTHADVSGGGGGGGGGATALSNGVAQTNLSGATGAYVKFTMAVPAGATGLKFVMSGGTGDADMYVKFGAEPSDTVYDCRPYVSGNAETCTIATAQAGTYYVNLKGYAAFSGVSLTGSYTAGGTNTAPTANFSYVTSGLTATFTDSSTDPQGNSTITGHSWNFGDGATSTSTSPSHTYGAAGTYSVSETVTDSGGLSNTKTSSVTVATSSCGGTVLCSGVGVALPSVATGGVSSNYTMPIAAGHTVTFTISGGTGDADLYVKAGSAPTTTSYSCRPYTTGNSETCSFTPTTATTYYINVRAYAAYSGVTLKGTSN